MKLKLASHNTTKFWIGKKLWKTSKTPNRAYKSEVYWGHECKKLIRPNFGCNVGRSDVSSMKLKLDVSCPLRNGYPKFQIDISKHGAKSSENQDGHYHSIIRSFFLVINKIHRRVIKMDRKYVRCSTVNTPGTTNARLNIVLFSMLHNG